MRKFKGLILVSILCLSVVPAWAQEQKLVDFSIKQWFSFGDASWQKSFPDGVGKAESELEFDIDSHITIFNLEVKPLYWLSVEANYGLGDISNGNVTDTDRTHWVNAYWTNPNTGEKILVTDIPVADRFESSVGEFDVTGKTKFYAINTYLRLFPYQSDAKFFVDMFIGYQHYEDNLNLGQGVQRYLIGTLSEDLTQVTDLSRYEAIPLYANSSYDFNWDFLKIGLRAESFFGRHPGHKTNPPEPTNFSMRVSIAAVPWISYKGEGIWGNRTDYRQDPSFRHEAEGLLFKDGGGFEGKISLTYSPWPWFLLEGGYQFLYLVVKNGVTTNYYVDGRERKNKLDEAEVTRQGPFIGLSLRF